MMHIKNSEKKFIEIIMDGRFTDMKEEETDETINELKKKYDLFRSHCLKELDKATVTREAARLFEKAVSQPEVRSRTNFLWPAFAAATISIFIFFVFFLPRPFSGENFDIDPTHLHQTAFSYTPSTDKGMHLTLNWKKPGAEGDQILLEYRSDLKKPLLISRKKEEVRLQMRAGSWLQYQHDSSRTTDVRIITPQITLFPVGTQFEINVAETSTRMNLKEGSIEYLTLEGQHGTMTGRKTNVIFSNYKILQSVSPTDQKKKKSLKRDVQGETLIWSEEFNSQTLDPSVWESEAGRGPYQDGWGNGELQYYTSAQNRNIRIKNGKLVIIARRDDYQGSQFTSARLNALKNMKFKYGRIEICAKVADGQGLTSSLWMLPVSGEWPVDGEIDIAEILGQEPDIVHSGVHYGPDPQSARQKIFPFKSKHSLSDSFHVYSMEWKEGRMEWYLDGQSYAACSASDTGSSWPFNRNEFYLILNLSVGGNWTDPPSESMAFPREMEIDYIRIYKKNIQ